MHKQMKIRKYSFPVLHEIFRSPTISQKRYYSERSVNFQGFFAIVGVRLNN